MSSAEEAAEAICSSARAPARGHTYWAEIMGEISQVIVWEDGRIGRFAIGKFMRHQIDRDDS